MKSVNGVCAPLAADHCVSCASARFLWIIYVLSSVLQCFKLLFLWIHSEFKWACITGRWRNVIQTNFGSFACVIALHCDVTTWCCWPKYQPSVMKVCLANRSALDNLPDKISIRLLDVRRMFSGVCARPYRPGKTCVVFVPPLTCFPPSLSWYVCFH